mgnify:FL=1
MTHADPEELAELHRDLIRIRQDHANVIEVEPKGTLREPLDQMLRYTKKRYEDVSEKNATYPHKLDEYPE